VNGKIALARQGLRAAMQLRRHLSLPREAAINAFDVARMVGADVRFLDAPSLEGMFVRDPGPRILLPSTKHRPKARILFSCAHEVGHQQFDHGTKADRYVEDGESGVGFVADEYLADVFAGHLLMPRAAVMEAFERRRWSAEACTPHQAFAIASELGVGYGTLITHLNAAMEILSSNHRDALSKVSPKTIKSDLAGAIWPGPLTIADAAWRHAPIDIEISELLILPTASGNGCGLLKLRGEHSGRSIYMAVRSGTGQLDIGGGPLSIRVARQHYIGPLKNRYLDDPDEH
jgi:IrrE N-terminal-like domain